LSLSGGEAADEIVMSRRARHIGGWIVSGLVLASLPGAPGQALRVYALWMMLATGGGAVLHTVYAVRSRGHQRRVWTLTAAGLACWAFAEVSVGVATVRTGAAPGRGLTANLLNLAALVLAVIAMLAVPTAPRTRTGRLRMLLDGAVAASALLGVAWSLVLEPLTRLEGSKDALFDLAYPVLAVGVLSVALIVFAGQSHRRGGALAAITGGVLVVSLTLLVEVLGQVAGLGWLRPWVLDGYMAAAGLLAIAPRYRLPRRGERAWQPAGLSASLLVYLPVAAYGIACIGPTLAGHRLGSPALWAGSVTVGAVLARQFLTLRRNVALTRDLAEQRSRFETEAVHDGLTGLPNRARLATGLDRADDDAFLLMIDLDGFKAVNDTLGHAAGDQLLITIADRLRAATAALGANALAARLGGDEFAVLVHRTDPGVVHGLAGAIVRAAAEPVLLDGRRSAVRASIGIARRRAGQPAVRLMHEADLALYEAKRRGKGQYRMFDAALSASVEEQRRLETELGGALAAGEFHVVYQPVVDLGSGRRIGVESLLCWHHPRLGVLEREQFEAAAAETGLLPEIERWMLGVALGRHAAWREIDPEFGLFVYLSAHYLIAGTVAADIGPVAADARVAVRISDTAAMAELVPAMRAIRELGVKVVLDSFGTGGSPLTQLRELPISAIKLDARLLRDVDRSPEAIALLGAVVALVASVGLNCLAGGVERPDQVAELRRLGCRRAVGPIFGPPAPASEVIVEPSISYVASRAAGA
jgi:diguanylate cyclase